jgi:alpha-L-fucosidase 2
MQIDGSFGVTAAICEMLVGEKNGEPYPLPALPVELKKGSVRGLCVRGNRRVDFDFEDGRVTSFKAY